MKAIVLAENDNTELRPLNSRKPGALIKINGISLLEHQIRGYLKAGVVEASITVVSGYHHNAVKRFLTRTAVKGSKITLLGYSYKERRLPRESERSAR